MRTTVTVKRQPNLLLPGLVLLSLLVHFFVYLHVSGFYRSSALPYIEFSLANVGKPVSRYIPRPTPRPKETERPRDAERVVPETRILPRIQPIQLQPMTGSYSKHVVEAIGMPAIDARGVQGDASAIYPLESISAAGGTYTSAKSYLEMIVLKIETKKRYPEEAKGLGEQGRVGVAFTVTIEGQLQDVRVEKPCRHERLNQAAIQAVRDAAPFPRPPATLFHKNIALQLNIIFELT
jgi:periplasmic protein TonB